MRAPTADAPTSGDAARAAVEQASRNLTESERRWPAVHRVTRALDRVLEENHLGEKIARTYRS